MLMAKIFLGTVQTDLSFLFLVLYIFLLGERKQFNQFGIPVEKNSSMYLRQPSKGYAQIGEIEHDQR